MSKFKLEFNMDGSAFTNGPDDKNIEIARIIARILRQLAELADENQLAERNIYDSNGNKIGHYAEVEED